MSASEFDCLLADDRWAKKLHETFPRDVRRAIMKQKIRYKFSKDEVLPVVMRTFSLCLR